LILAKSPNEGFLIFDLGLNHAPIDIPLYNLINFILLM
jgi:hypothetical protein